MKNKKLWLVGTLSIFGLVLIIGTSYAYWRFSKISDGSNAALSGCFSVSLSNEANAISLENAYPISDEDGKKLKPYSFTITNTCSIFAKYYVNLEMLEGTTLNSKYVAVRVNNENIQLLSEFNEDTNRSLSTSTEARTLATGYLGSGDSIDYSVAFWMDESVTINDTDAMNKNFKSKIMVKAEPSSYSPVDSGYNTLHDAILANEYQTTPEIAIEKIKAKQSSSITDNGDGTYTVTNTAPIIKWTSVIGDAVTKDIVKPSIDAIKSDSQTVDLTENDVKLKFYKNISFNTDTGKYTLSDPIYVEPDLLSYDESTHYYFKNEYISYNYSTKKLYTVVENDGISVYEVTGAYKTDTKTIWNGIEYSALNYKLSLVTMTESELETDKSDKGLYAGTDDYGTTYYYRGNVKNNNVYFAGYYWQVVRINGDGSIRLMYNGQVKNASGIDQSINNKLYQFNVSYNSPAYVGYMYGTNIGTRENNIKNENNSIVKTLIDDWYKTNLLEAYDSYIDDAGFCGDRSIYSGDGIKIDKSTAFSSLWRRLNQIFQFKCSNMNNDLYTASESNIGNKSLTYPVGLVTYDELVLAGLNDQQLNKLSYAYSSQNYWTMTPGSFSSTFGYAYAWRSDNPGFLSYRWVNMSNSVRPVINLKADVEITEGICTANDPYVIKTE